MPSVLRDHRLDRNSVEGSYGIGASACFSYGILESKRRSVTQLMQQGTGREGAVPVGNGGLHMEHLDRAAMGVWYGVVLMTPPKPCEPPNTDADSPQAT